MHPMRPTGLLRPSARGFGHGEAGCTCVIAHAWPAIAMTCIASVVGGTLQLEDATCCLRRIRGGQGASAEAGSSGPESQPSKSLVSNSTESRFREVGAWA